MSSITRSRKKDKSLAEGVLAEDGEYLISDLAHAFDVTLRALRFYEDRGLLAPRRIGTMRIYSAQDRTRLSVILKGKQLGFTLAEIQEMLETDARVGTAGVELKLSVEKIDEQIRHLEAQRAEVEAAIEELQAARARIVG